MDPARKGKKAEYAPLPHPSLTGKAAAPACGTPPQEILLFAPNGFLSKKESIPPAATAAAVSVAIASLGGIALLAAFQPSLQSLAAMFIAIFTSTAVVTYCELSKRAPPKAL